MFSPVCTESGFIGQSQHCSSLASCGQCSGTDLLRTEMRIAEGVGSERLGCCKRFLRAELDLNETRRHFADGPGAACAAGSSNVRQCAIKELDRQAPDRA